MSVKVKRQGGSSRLRWPAICMASLAMVILLGLAGPAEACFLLSPTTMELGVGHTARLTVQCSEECEADVTARPNRENLIDISPEYQVIGSEAKTFYVTSQGEEGETTIEVRWQCGAYYGVWTIWVTVARLTGGPTDSFGCDGTMIVLYFGVGFPLMEATQDTQDQVRVASENTSEISGQSLSGLDKSPQTLVYGWTFPDGSQQAYELSLPGSGTLGNGIVWSAAETLVTDVEAIDLTFQIPASVYNWVAPGEQITITYQTKTAAGLSNPRWEYRTVSQDSSQDLIRLAQPVVAQADQYNFKMMASYFDGSDLVWPTDAVADVYVNDALSQSLNLDEGMLDVSVSPDQTTRLVLSSSLFSDITLLFTLTDGQLAVYEESDGSQSVVQHGQTPEGDWTIEYYRNQVLICNQGQAGGPILGPIQIPVSEAN